ncbi:helix-turn-helix domain-containing protein [Synechococcus elongatus]|uniref:helix-turn-helix domain-containing protein n=1 Tax=Synechococcus elongatus TaxID=32046 RepID=UPI000306A978|nr:helix-turn-helix transcriptional regulator [Synechococcus elongatus]MBD2588663.1 helix-turn-helix transcriptional regulator [Synechococcus elongatus FACHB-242]MBD2689748.1 helix-turn-helix transcriptional regulator [Synechococcus elongatus FACHB-1061]MBD2708355.1 helix-turn-helix transcriptional regulator [Synechococcus elongatus PCC 7942 = FACHB-805]UOW70561.1 HTH transcriptional regulator [Synechococcus elongatus PCC 7943]UOW73282.1 HTH transcriptional regulator [Synechococcus elongatus P
MKVRCKLPELIRDAGLTQGRVATEAGLSPVTVSKLCRQHFSQIDVETVYKLCRFFQLKSIDDLLEIERSEPS